MNGRRLTIGLAVSAIGCPFVVYVAAYFALVQKFNAVVDLQSVSWSHNYGNDLLFSTHVDWFFQPMHYLDRTWIRPGYWHRESPGPNVSTNDPTNRHPHRWSRTNQHRYNSPLGASP